MLITNKPDGGSEIRIGGPKSRFEGSKIRFWGPFFVFWVPHRLLGGETSYIFAQKSAIWGLVQSISKNVQKLSDFLVFFPPFPSLLGVVEIKNDGNVGFLTIFTTFFANNAAVEVFLVSESGQNRHFGGQIFWR